LSSKDLRRNPIAIFNSILSARLICVLDFVFAETTLVRRPARPAACWSTTDPLSDLPSRSPILALSRTFVAGHQENL